MIDDALLGPTGLSGSSLEELMADGDAPDGAIEAAVERLRQVNTDRLHPVERMIVTDILAEFRHLKCKGCLAMVERLIAKAEGR